MAPVFRGHFLVQPAAGIYPGICDKSAQVPVGSNNGFASWHIAYKDASIALVRHNQIRERWGDGRAVYGDRQPDLAMEHGCVP